jgi:lipopolysaccharide transport system ATP-binding protein
MSAITVDSVSKKFKLPKDKKRTLFHNVIGVIKRSYDYQEFWALKNISFEIQRGETFGIIGRNGSGKSTLLKILAKVLYPDSGSVSMDGKVASFLELGVGFQPELTAEENVYIYASILGMGGKEVRRNYAAIFDFAELNNFQNMKLKNFSSGMFLRLAFSTAIHATPDTLLIDEVFAVGDTSFQKKCAAKIEEIKAQGRTIVFVSHNLDSVQELCRKTLLINKGQMVSIGETEEVINQYQKLIKGGS